VVDELRSELVLVRKAVDRERKLRMQLEEQVKMLEAQLYPDKVREIAQQVHVKFSSEGNSSQGNSESEEAAAVASLVDDEVIAETIEIETQICPDSPSSQATTIVISTAPTNCISSASIAPLHMIPLTTQAVSSPRIIHVTESKETHRPKANNKSPQPAAIALPIDVPFIGSTNAPGTVTLQIVGPSSNEHSVNVSNTSRHNLETIVEAIRHLEGDHLFKDEDATVTVLKEYETEEIIADCNIQEIELRTSEPITTKSGHVKHVLTVSPEQLGAIRQQVIMSSQSRPGVIVAKNP